MSDDDNAPKVEPQYKTPAYIRKIIETVVPAPHPTPPAFPCVAEALVVLRRASADTALMDRDVFELFASLPTAMLHAIAKGWPAQFGEVLRVLKIRVLINDRDVKKAIAFVASEVANARNGIVARTKDGKPMHGPRYATSFEVAERQGLIGWFDAPEAKECAMPEVPSVLTMNGRIYPPTHADDLARMRACRTKLAKGERVDYVATPDDHLAAHAINEIREQVAAQSEMVERTMTPAMWGATIKERIAEYEAMGFIGRGDAVVLAGVKDPSVSVGRVMKSDDEVDALVRAFNHGYSETPMNESQKQAMIYGQNAVYGKNATKVTLEERIETATRDELFAIARDHFGVLLRSNETDEESRVRLRKAIAHRRESEARMPTKIDAANVQCTIACAQCGHANVYPLGETDPKESTCTHRFRFAPEKGRMGALICCVCPLTIPREDLERLNIDPEKRYSRDGSALADVLTQLRQENLKVFAENAMLRRQLESLERRAKAKR